MCNKEKFWPILCEMIGHPEWGKDDRFRTFKDRLANRALIQELLDEALSARTTDDWLSAFGGRVPAAPIYDVKQALENPFVAAQEMIQTLTNKDGTEFRMIDSPFRTGEPTPNRPGPDLGEDTDELLGELGMSDAEITALRKNGTV